MTAWMFPGQGSQFPGMARDLVQQFPAAAEVLAEAEALAGTALDSIRQRGPVESMTRVEVAEPLLAAVSIAYAQTLLDAGVAPDTVAGYSAGEVAALFVAGVLTRTDALKVATIRGRVLARHTHPRVQMTVISRLPSADVDRFIASYRDSDELVEIAGFNAPDHVTIVGTDSAVRWAENALVAAGAETSEVLVSGMWHSSQLSSATRELADALESIPFAEPRIPIRTSATGSVQKSPDLLRQDLAKQISTPVRWQSIVDAWRAEGVTDVVEVGAGRTLLGMLRRNWLDASSYAVTTVEGRAGNIKPLKRILSSLTT